MNDRSSSDMLRFLVAAACVVIVMWGVRTASHLLTVLFIALLLAYCVLPFPKWLMRRFLFPKGPAIALTVALWIVLHVVFSLFLAEVSVHIKAKLPIYEEHFRILFEHAEVFLNSHHINLASVSAFAKSSPARIINIAEEVLPSALGVFSDRLLIGLLSLLFLVEMAENDELKRGALGRGLAYYGEDVQRFIMVMAKTGAITALANYILLLAVGVDFAALWCVLYFFLHFIPDLGILISIVPPTLLALITLGWKRALIVVIGLLLTNAIGDYVLRPKFMKKAVHLSFLGIMLSLLVWGFLLGVWGGILAIPLTLALRRFVERFSAAPEVASASSG